MAERTKKYFCSMFGKRYLTILQQCRLMIIVAVVLLIFGNLNVNATGIDGFMDIPWGTSRGEVAQKMAELNYSKDPDSNAERDIYNGMFVGRKAYLSFFYINNLFYKSNVYFIDTYHSPKEGDYRSTVDYYFKDFETQLISKYGNPSLYPGGYSGDCWNIENQGTSISIELGKSYGDRSSGRYSGVTITYTNGTFYTKAKQHSANQDL